MSFSSQVTSLHLNHINECSSKTGKSHPLNQILITNFQSLISLKKSSGVLIIYIISSLKFRMCLNFSGYSRQYFFDSVGLIGRLLIYSFLDPASGLSCQGPEN